ncbi:MAG: hypothetical protein RBG13Loki_3013 [Promethearchaeota archaeon CR_4]|nr:MAG: hypothetical protein RBG13Loki_3013 [Candidatus Lokiarchaeota archaeon CR_4]
MAIFEMGIIKNGVLIFSKTFYPLDADVKTRARDQNLRSQILSSIIHFANNCLSTEVEYFVMRKYQIAIASQQVIVRGGKNFVVAYVIGDSDLEVEIVNESLERVLSNFIEKYQNEWGIVENTAKYSAFEKILFDIFGDLHYRPSDRVRKLFNT